MGLYYAASHVPLNWQPAVFTLIFGHLNGVGITGGYHRLWTHRAFRATKGLRYYLAINGAVTFQGSIPWWVQHHRAHHRYLDSDKDPYNARRGLFYSHVG